MFSVKKSECSQRHTNDGPRDSTQQIANLPLECDWSPPVAGRNLWEKKTRILYMGVEPKIGENPQNGWFIMENPTKMDDLGGPPLFLETPI